ncbi:MAG TPA: LPS export ABC transporter permease LptF [Gammaproteobacteria bacterium]|nr:LPS export ABC transporter permease LptF [Gammaproteobacteria bacterium]
MIIERYIHREILHRFFWITGLLVLIFGSNRFVDYLSEAAVGKIGSGLIFNLMWLKIIAIQPKLLPLTLFLAVILAYSRMSRDNELLIFSASGMGGRYQLGVVTRFAVVFSILFAFLAFYASPWAEMEIATLKQKAREESDITGIAAGRFKEFSEGDRVVYVEKLSSNKQAMENVFLQVRENNRLGVLTSKGAHFDIDEDSGNRFIVFDNGRRYVGKPGRLDYQITEYNKYGVLIEVHNPTAAAADLEAVPTSVLLVSDLPLHRAELQWRISAVLSCLLLALLALVLNQLTYSEQRYLLLFSAILIYFLYSNLLSISKTLLKRDELSQYIGMWWVHILMIAAILFLYYLPNIARWRRKKQEVQVLEAER